LGAIFGKFLEMLLVGCIYYPFKTFFFSLS
jgi:hypothetical protein